MFFNDFFFHDEDKTNMHFSQKNKTETKTKSSLKINCFSSSLSQIPTSLFKQSSEVIQPALAFKNRVKQKILNIW